MTGIHGLQHIKRFFAPALAKDDSIRTHAERVSDQLTLTNFAFALDVRRSSFQSNDMRLLELKLGGVFNRDKAFEGRN